MDIMNIQIQNFLTKIDMFFPPRRCDDTISGNDSPEKCEIIFVNWKYIKWIILINSMTLFGFINTSTPTGSCMASEEVFFQGKGFFVLLLNESQATLMSLRWQPL